MKSIQFSIIVPVYNRQETISNAIESVLAQDYNNWELIIIDDGSIDDTKKVCESFSKKDKRIRYFYKKNGGVCSARNYGIKNARGNYILFLDSDDTYNQEALNKLNDIADEFSNIDMFCFGYGSSSTMKWIPDNSNKIVTREMIDNMYLPTHINLYKQNKFFLKNFIWNKCYKLKFLKEYNIKFDENRRTWEDGKFIIECLEKANSIFPLSDVLYCNGNNDNIEHLSSKIYLKLLLQYISDETEFKNKFCKKYNFNNEYYCRSNFDVTNQLIERTINAYGFKSIEVIRNAINEPIVLFWISHLNSENIFEKNIIKNIESGKYKNIFFSYKLRIFIHKLKMFFK